MRFVPQFFMRRQPATQAHRIVIPRENAETRIMRLCLSLVILTATLLSGCYAPLTSPAVPASDLPESFRARTRCCRVFRNMGELATPLADYHLGPGDIVDVVIPGLFPDAEFRPLRVQLTDSGHVHLPDAGPIFLGGATLQEAHARINSAFEQDVILDPSVSVTLVERATIPVVVLGEVNMPGVYRLTRGENDIANALAAAGGVTLDSDDYLEVHRNPYNSGLSGTQQFPSSDIPSLGNPVLGSDQPFGRTTLNPSPLTMQSRQTPEHTFAARTVAWQAPLAANQDAGMSRLSPATRGSRYPLETSRSNINPLHTGSPGDSLNAFDSHTSRLQLSSSILNQSSSPRMTPSRSPHSALAPHSINSNERPALGPSGPRVAPNAHPAQQSPASGPVTQHRLIQDGVDPHGIVQGSIVQGGIVQGGIVRGGIVRGDTVPAASGQFGGALPSTTDGGLSGPPVSSSSTGWHPAPPNQFESANTEIIHAGSNPQNGFYDVGSPMLDPNHGYALSCNMTSPAVHRIALRGQMLNPVAPEHVVLEAGDVLVVPRRKQQVFYVVGQLNRNNGTRFSLDNRDREIGSGFLLPPDRDIDVVTAVAMAGYLDPIDSPTTVSVHRVLPDGNPLMVRVDLIRARYDRSENIIIQPGDIVYLNPDAPWWFRRTLDAAIVGIIDATYLKLLR